MSLRVIFEKNRIEKKENFHLKWFSIHICSDALHKNTRTDVFSIITPNRCLQYLLIQFISIEIDIEFDIAINIVIFLKIDIVIEIV